MQRVAELNQGYLKYKVRGIWIYFPKQLRCLGLFFRLTSTFIVIHWFAGIGITTAQSLDSSAVNTIKLKKGSDGEMTRDTAEQDTFSISLPTFRTLSFSFSSHEEALDSLLTALLKKKGMPVQAYLPKSLFTQQWKLHDTAASQQIIDGAWMGYQYQFSKSFQKTRKYLLKNKIVLKRSEIGNRPMKITEDSEGSGIRKYEYIVMYKKMKYVLSYQLWWINDKGYWVNAIEFRLKPVQ